MLSGLLKRLAKQAPAEALPASLEAAIKGMTVAIRGDDGEGNARTMLAFAGESISSWYHTPAETSRRIAAAWPGLTDAQLTAACRAVAGTIRAQDRNGATARERSTWASWKSARTPIFSE